MGTSSIKRRRHSFRPCESAARQIAGMSAIPGQQAITSNRGYCILKEDSKPITRKFVLSTPRLSRITCKQTVLFFFFLITWNTPAQLPGTLLRVLLLLEVFDNKQKQEKEAEKNKFLCLPFYNFLWYHFFVSRHVVWTDALVPSNFFAVLFKKTQSSCNIARNRPRSAALCKDSHISYKISLMFPAVNSQSPSAPCIFPSSVYFLRRSLATPPAPPHHHHL